MFFKRATIFGKPQNLSIMLMACFKLGVYQLTREHIGYRRKGKGSFTSFGFYLNIWACKCALKLRKGKSHLNFKI